MPHASQPNPMIARRQSARHARRILIGLIAAAPLPIGCGGPPSGHPAIGQTVGSLPIVSIREPSKNPPTLAGKVTLLNFWGTWCPPCRRELPGMARIAGRLADEPGFQLIAISCGAGGPDEIDEIRDTTKAFLAEQRLTLDPWADPDGMTRMIFSEQFGFSAYPTTYLIGPDRRIRAVWTGFRGRDEAEMAAAVVEALKTLPGSAAPAAAVAR